MLSFVLTKQENLLSSYTRTNSSRDTLITVLQCPTETSTLVLYYINIAMAMLVLLRGGGGGLVATLHLNQYANYTIFHSLGSFEPS